MQTSVYAGRSYEKLRALSCTLRVTRTEEIRLCDFLVHRASASINVCTYLFAVDRYDILVTRVQRSRSIKRLVHQKNMKEELRKKKGKTECECSKKKVTVACGDVFKGKCLPNQRCSADYENNNRVKSC